MKLKRSKICLWARQKGGEVAGTWLRRLTVMSKQKANSHEVKDSCRRAHLRSASSAAST
jgi:hypothetical protein